MTTQGQCPLCKGAHRLYHCDKFISKLPTKRLECVKQLRACFNCLRPFSKGHVCSNYACHNCHQRHHTTLHIAMQTRSADRHSSTNSHNAGSTANHNVTHVTNNSTDKAQTYCSFKTKLTNHVLLATAVVEVRNKYNQYVPCRVLLDSASQVNFITEQCVQRLRLARHQSATSIQGINDVNTATHHSVSIHLRSRRTDWHTSLTCAVLPNITSNSPATKLDTTNWNLPKDIQLADEHFDKPGTIDLLIGADLFLRNFVDT